jgi:hypothetical protein
MAWLQKHWRGWGHTSLCSQHSYLEFSVTTQSLILTIALCEGMSGQWIGPNWTTLDRIGPHWTTLDQIHGPHWTRSNSVNWTRIGPNWTNLDHLDQVQSGLIRVLQNSKFRDNVIRLIMSCIFEEMHQRGQHCIYRCRLMCVLRRSNQNLATASAAKNRPS